MGSHQGSLATKKVDGIAMGRGHETEAVGRDAATFIPGVCSDVIDLAVMTNAKPQDEMAL